MYSIGSALETLRFQVYIAVQHNCGKAGSRIAAKRIYQDDQA